MDAIESLLTLCGGQIEFTKTNDGKYQCIWRQSRDSVGISEVGETSPAALNAVAGLVEKLIGPRRAK